jgi:hypothetical protein
LVVEMLHIAARGSVFHRRLLYTAVDVHEQ